LAKIYENDAKDFDDSSRIYCCLSMVKLKNTVKTTVGHFQWEVKKTMNGDNTYKTNDEEGLEPFYFTKLFTPRFFNKIYRCCRRIVLYFRLLRKRK
jgi:hypothetical protein